MTMSPFDNLISLITGEKSARETGAVAAPDPTQTFDPPPPCQANSTKAAKISRFSRSFDDRGSDLAGSRRLGCVA
ncbi:hypothetical protein, partial [Acetobacter nitrogenifigens]|uniref:hypothetical protein n=1 Tax=Acetobacter nitrogenifigens TaxID=285268 RepID=UPI001C3FA48C